MLFAPGGGPVVGSWLGVVWFSRAVGEMCLAFADYQVSCWCAWRMLCVVCVGGLFGKLVRAHGGCLGIESR